MQTQSPIKYCLYARKSSESDERQAMSIDSQVKEMMAMAEREGLLVTEVRQESHSAKLSGKRPVFKQLLDDIRQGKFTGILTWAPDRLSRNAGDLGSLVDMMDDNRLQHIRTFSQTFSNTPNEKFLLMILCSQAKLENDNRGVNVKRGIRAKCEMGWRPCMPPMGYFSRSMAGLKDIMVDPDRAPTIKEMFERAAKGQSGRHIQSWLENAGFKSRTNGRVSISMIYMILKNPFYYGRFEYPAKSGSWYDGSHEPLITKDLFDKVQRQIEVPQKAKWGAKEFPFKRFLTCSRCGSNVTASEVLRKKLDGTTNRHVYYHCSRSLDYYCSEPSIKERDLSVQLYRLIEQRGINLSMAEPGLVKAVTKFSTMAQTLEPRIKSGLHHAVVKYAEFVLNYGSDFEKERLMRGLGGAVKINDRRLSVTQSSTPYH